MARRSTSIVLLIVALLVLFAACCKQNNTFNATMYGSVYENNSHLKTSFLEAHLTKGSWSSAREEYVDDGFPEFQTVKICNQEQFEDAFNDFSEDVDFEERMILMHGFTTASGASYELKRISVEHLNLTVEYYTKDEMRKIPNASMPQTKWIILVMDKSDYETSNVIFKNQK